jgi:hypothetical protein
VGEYPTVEPFAYEEGLEFQDVGSVVSDNGTGGGA